MSEDGAMRFAYCALRATATLLTVTEKEVARDSWSLGKHPQRSLAMNAIGEYQAVLRNYQTSES
jgi:hypothetical protein